MWKLSHRDFEAAKTYLTSGKPGYEPRKSCSRSSFLCYPGSRVPIASCFRALSLSSHFFEMGVINLTSWGCLEGYKLTTLYKNSRVSGLRGMMTGSPRPTHTAVSSPPPHAAWGYLKLQEMFHPHLALMFMPPRSVMGVGQKPAKLDSWEQSICGELGIWEERRPSVLAAFQQPDLERESFASLSHVFLFAIWE